MICRSHTKICNLLDRSTLSGKLVSSTMTIFNESFAVSFFVTKFNLSSYESDSFCLHCYIESFNIDISTNQRNP